MWYESYRKTSVCFSCGQEWIDATPDCPISEDKKHNFVFVQTPVNDKKAVRKTLFCSNCCQEWGNDIHCKKSADGKHAFKETTCEDCY